MTDPRLTKAHPHSKSGAYVHVSESSASGSAAPTPRPIKGLTDAKQSGPSRKHVLLGNPEARATNVLLAGLGPATRSSKPLKTKELSNDDKKEVSGNAGKDISVGGPVGLSQSLLPAVKGQDNNKKPRMAGVFVSSSDRKLFLSALPTYNTRDNKKGSRMGGKAIPLGDRALFLSALPASKPRTTENKGTGKDDKKDMRMAGKVISSGDRAAFLSAYEQLTINKEMYIVGKGAASRDPGANHRSSLHSQHPTDRDVDATIGSIPNNVLKSNKVIVRRDPVLGLLLEQ